VLTCFAASSTINVVMKKLLILLCAFSSVFAQPPDTLWTRTYGTDETEEAFGCVALEDGGFVLAGISGDPGLDNERVYVVRVDSFGDTLWTKRFGEFWPSPNVFGHYWGAYSICRAGDNGLALTGYGQYLGDMSIYIFLLKMSSDGDSLWTRVYDHEGWGNRVVATEDGGFAIAGDVWHPNRDMMLMKTDSLGNEEWSRFYGGTGSEAAHDMTLCPDGGFALAGGTSSFGVDVVDVYLVRTNSSGDTLWTRTYGGMGDESAFTITARTDGGFVLAGYTDSFGMGGPLGTDAYVLRVDSEGDTVWTRTYGYAETDEFISSVASTIDGGCILSGWISGWSPHQDMYVVRLDSLGDSLWSSTYGGIWPDNSRCVVTTIDSGYCIVGKFRSLTNPPEYEFYAVRLGPDIQSTEEPFSFIPEEITLTAYPNPFNPSTTIGFYVQNPAQIEIAVYDVQGRLVKQLTSGKFTRGRHEIIFEANALPSGTYYAQLNTPTSKFTQKLVLVK
jgi:hypothetical protein